ncbi:MAG TPA: restriction endonuclease subunit S [Bacilli bacterium]|nr:restriction endonuclease subunit S [Bacilli bacterium]
MKYSGIKWIGKIPDNWNVRKVKQCFYISKEQAHEENPTILSLARAGVKVRDISNNEGQLAASYDNYNPVMPGDLLLNPMDLYSGANCSLSEVSGVISPAYINLKKKVELNPKFYDYYFKTQYWAMAMFAHGKGVSFDNRWTMNAETLLNYYLPFPSSDVQDKIVDLINKKTAEIDSLIEIENQQIEKLKEYKQAVITETVTKGLDNNVAMKDSGVDWIKKIPYSWKVVPLKSLFNNGKGLPITKENLTESGIKVISYGQIHAKYNNPVSIDERLYRFVAEEWLKTNSECLVKKSDFIFADTSEDVSGSGDFIYIDREDKIFAGYHCVVLKAKTKQNYKYLAYLFMSQLWKNQIQCKVKGVKLFSISQTILMSTSVILPSIEEQKEIVSKLDSIIESINKTIEIKHKKIEQLEEYKKSLIFEYVTGKKEVC